MIQAGREVAEPVIESQLTDCLQAHIARAQCKQKLLRDLVLGFVLYLVEWISAFIVIVRSCQWMVLSKSDTQKYTSSLMLASGWILMLKLNVIEINWSVDQRLHQFKGKIAKNPAICTSLFQWTKARISPTRSWRRSVMPPTRRWRSLTSWTSSRRRTRLKRSPTPTERLPRLSFGRLIVV